MRTLLRAIRTSLRDILHEKDTVVLLIGASVAYALFYPVPYSRQILRDLPVIVVDRDHTALSRQFARWLDASEAAAVSARSNDLEAAQDALRGGTAGAVLLIPQDFERHVQRGEPAYVEAWADASYFLVYSTALRAISGVAATLSANISVHRAQAAGVYSPAAIRYARPVVLAPWPLFNPVAGYGTFVVPAVFVLILQQTLLIGIASLRVSERREAGSGEPIWATLAGRVGAISLIYLGHALFMFGVVLHLYGFPMRAAWPDVLLFLIPFFAATTLLGLAVAELFERAESATVALAAMAVPSLFLSGISFPAEVQAGWARALAVVLPSTYGIRGFLQLGVMGATLGETLRSWSALWIQVVVYWGLAWAVLKYRRNNPLRAG